MTCTDVSTYGTVKWIQVEREKCKAKFPKRTIPREKRVNGFLIDTPMVK